MLTRLEAQLFRLLSSWRTYCVAAWVVALIAAAIALYSSWHSFDNVPGKSMRADGNGGHATIDFAGQWLMGRMLVTGHGRQLYNRLIQRQVLIPAFPDEDHEPGKSDVDDLMSWLMGRDELVTALQAGPFVLPLASESPLPCSVLTRISLDRAQCRGGPLYPPINAFVYAPLAFLPPRQAYHLQQIINLGLVFTAGLGLRTLSRGRLWCPVVTVLLMLFPGFGGSIQLGQNSTLTLNIIIWGWLLASRGHSIKAGMVWGLLAFKPVWALAFFLVPLLTGRWRLALTMATTGLALCLATLPVVGWHVWLDWLAVGRDAARLYSIEENWIFLSRDLLGFPRRYLLDFKNTPLLERDKNDLVPTVLGYGSLLLVLEITLRVTLLRRQEAAQVVAGPPAAFLFLGAWMLCFHFMYYDVLLAALPVFLLFHEPDRYIQPISLAIIPLGESTPRDYHTPSLGTMPRLSPLPWLQPHYGQIWVLNRAAPTAYVLLVFTQFGMPHLSLGAQHGPPWDTMVLFLLWLWCGWQWLRHGERVAISW